MVGKAESNSVDNAHEDGQRRLVVWRVMARGCCYAENVTLLVLVGALVG